MEWWQDRKQQKYIHVDYVGEKVNPLLKAHDCKSERVDPNAASLMWGVERGKMKAESSTNSVILMGCSITKAMLLMTILSKMRLRTTLWVTWLCTQVKMYLLYELGIVNRKERFWCTSIIVFSISTAVTVWWFYIAMWYRKLPLILRKQHEYFIG